jgi:hypothetical protein
MTTLSITNKSQKTGASFQFPQSSGSCTTEIPSKRSKNVNKTLMLSSISNLYDKDFLAWIEATAQLLKQGKLSELDIENLIEEVEDLAKSEKRQLKNRLRVLLMHLLKWQHQPDFRSYPETDNNWIQSSWSRTIIEQRDSIKDLLSDSPSLYNYLSENLAESYSKARSNAARETHLEISVFPKDCPYTESEILNEEFWPN